jgi:hypothetical protein
MCPRHRREAPRQGAAFTPMPELWQGGFEASRVMRASLREELGRESQDVSCQIRPIQALMLSPPLSLRKVGTQHCGSRRSIDIPVYLKTPERPPGLAGAPGYQSTHARSQCRGCGSETS